MNDSPLNIEEIRRRAKDNKSRYAEYFLTYSFNTLDRFRNLLITLSVVGFGFFQTKNLYLENKTRVLSLIFLSILSGVVNYITSYLSTMYESNYYSQIEKIFSEKAFPSSDEYEKMTKKENIERNKKNNFWWLVSMIFLCLQTIFLLCALKDMI